MFPAPGSHGSMGNFIAWDARAGKIVWSKPEKFSVWSGALATAGDIVFYGTLEGYLKAVTPRAMARSCGSSRRPPGSSATCSRTSTGQAVRGRYSGIGGWAGIGMAAGLDKDTDGLGAVGGYRELREYTDLGGSLTVFAIPGGN